MSFRTPQTVPEPANTAALIGLVFTGAALLLQHRRRFNNH
ncbi:PEP-CTERM sorting domain-containing protein [Nostoc sp. MS1]|nr:PEP-CTERM sorting domain-containing protein [Nostoc sp. MS1]